LPACSPLQKEAPHPWPVRNAGFLFQPGQDAGVVDDPVKGHLPWMLVFTPVFTRACSWSPQFLEASFLARPSCRAPVTRPVPVRQCSCRAHASERAILSVRTPSSAPASPGLPQPHRCNSCDDVTTRVCIEGGEERRGAQAAENASPEEYGTLRAGGVPRPPPRLPPDPRIKVAAQPQPASRWVAHLGLVCRWHLTKH